MTTLNIKQELHSYLEVADAKKLKALYTIFEEEVKAGLPQYSEESKATLDERASTVSLGTTKTISATESKKRINKILKKGK
jgi:hypothetical protein